MKKQYIGISRDHSGSMNGLARAAKDDYNQTIAAIKTASKQEDIDTIVSVVKQGGGIEREVVNSGIDRLKPLTSYSTPGSNTPLFDSIADLIQLLGNAPDSNNQDVSFLIIAVTDGEENASRISGSELARRIREKQNTDRWTFVFRVPRGSKQRLVGLGIPSGNIQEWDGFSETEFRENTVRTQSAISNYYGGISRGLTSSKTFYADVADVSRAAVRNQLDDISNEVRVFNVRNRSEIGPFIALSTFQPYRKGTAFYQLSKTEKIVQSYKQIVIQNRNTGKVFSGENARDLLNLPDSKNIKLAPGNHGEWDIFVQSTSTNRILLPGTQVLYWPNAQSQ